jgi:signal transduction histidine kinase
VLANLVANALHHVERGGMIRISVRRQHGRTVIEVEDTGGGIDGESLPRVFEPGFSKDGGLGLGLAVARELTERMGGTIGVASDQSGTRFTLRF